GQWRMRKAVSRSPLVWQRAIAIYEDVRQANVRLESFVELGGRDDNAQEVARIDVSRSLAKVARLNNNLLELERKLAATPQRYVNVRAELVGKIVRSKVKCSQQVRSIRFHAAQWKQFRGAIEHAVEEISRLERALNSFERREVKRMIGEHETAAG